jgi:hypothetical protein
MTRPLGRAGVRGHVEDAWIGKVATREMTLRASEPVSDWWDDELDVLVKRCIAVFGEDATDDAVVRVAEHCRRGLDLDDAPVLLEALAPVLAETLKAEFRRVLTPH